MRLHFTGANLLLSFSHLNFYFQVTTVYEILRLQGVKLGKRGFIRLPLVKQWLGRCQSNSGAHGTCDAACSRPIIIRGVRPTLSYLPFV